MKNLKTTALSIVAIMLISSLSGLAYHNITNQPSFQLEFASHASDLSDSDMNRLYEDYECLAEAHESCETLHEFGYTHNVGLHKMALVYQSADIYLGMNPDKDLLMYDRLVMSTADSKVMETYNSQRGFLQHSLELANYTDNMSMDEKKDAIINGTTDDLDSYCDLPLTNTFEEDYLGQETPEMYDVCLDISDEISPILSAARDTIYEDGDDSGLDKLIDNEGLTNQSSVILHILHSIGYASRGYWTCSDYATPNVRHSFEHSTRGADAWCDSFTDETAEEDASAETSSEDEKEETEARHGHQGFYKSLTKEQKKQFWIDIIGAIGLLVVAVVAIIGIVGAITVTGGTATVAWSVLLTEASHLMHAIEWIIHFLHSVFGVHVVHDDYHSDPGSLDGYWDNQKIGDVTIIGAGYTSYSYSSVNPSAFIDCPYDYQAFLSGGFSSNLQRQYLQYDWQLHPAGVVPPGLDGWVDPGGNNDHVTQARFFQDAEFILVLTVSHPTALDSPKTIVKQINANHRCGDPPPMDVDYEAPADPVWNGMIIGSPSISGETWAEHGLRDLAHTNKQSTWLNSRDCDSEDWGCYAGSVAGIQHNNYLALLSEANQELKLSLDMYSENNMNNLDALVVHTQSETTINTYRSVRNDLNFIEDAIRIETQKDENKDKSAIYVAAKAMVVLGTSAGVPAEAIDPLASVVAAWNEDNFDEDYEKALRLAIDDEKFSEYSHQAQTLLHQQLGVMDASQRIAGISSADQAEADARGGKWHRLMDAGLLIGGAAAVLSGGPAGWLGGGSMLLGGASSLAKNSHSDEDDGGHGTGGTHDGFGDTIPCDTRNLTQCVSTRLVEVNYFSEAKIAAANSVNQCGEDPTLTTLETAVQKDFYIAGDPIEWTLTVNCAILDYEYQIKTEVIQSLTGDVAYGEKTEWWVQTNTDYTTTFNMRIDNGLDIGEYCVNSLLIEAFNPVIVASSSGTGTGYCFDVDPARSDGSGDGTSDGDDDDDGDEGGLPIPGFTGMTALIAMLGAAIIAFRRLEDQ